MIPRDEIVSWLRETDPSRLDSLWSVADDVRRIHVGNSIHLRGIINFSNNCVRRCTYCGINADNRGLRRYRMSTAEIMECVRSFEELSLMTVVLQSGEDRLITRSWVAELVDRIRQETGLAVTLSLGERQEEELSEWRAAGAERYLLKIETSNRLLYESMQPDRRNAWTSRMEVLRTLRSLDYEVGTGIMVGIPGQTHEMLADDLVHFGEFGPDMIGIGPYIPHPATSLPSVPHDRTDQVPNDLVTTLNVLALARMICPDANIPATTALLSIGRRRDLKVGLSGGANVIMPDLTPPEYRQLYDIYPTRLSPGQGDLLPIQEAIASMGRSISEDSGTSLHYLKCREAEGGIPAGSIRHLQELTE